MRFNINDKIVVVNSDCGADGLVGEVIEEVTCRGVKYYKVEFGIDVGKYTKSEKYSTVMALTDEYMFHFEEVFKDDLDSLINLALDTHDEEWFDELVYRKTMQEVF